MQHVFVDGAYLFFLSITVQLKRLHHKSPIKLSTFKKEKVPYLNQLEMKFLKLLRAKYFDKKTRLSKWRGYAGPTAHLQKNMNSPAEISALFLAMAQQQVCSAAPNEDSQEAKVKADQAAV